MSHLVLLYYCFTDVADPGKEAELQRAWCQELGLKGRIIIAFEGINGTVSGLAEDAQGYMEKMAEHPLFKDTEFKVDEHSGNSLNESTGGRTAFRNRPISNSYSFRISRTTAEGSANLS